MQNLMIIDWQAAKLVLLKPNADKNRSSTAN